MLFKCRCGLEGKSTYKRVRQESFSGCQDCLRKKSGILNQKEAEEIFERKGFKLLSKYESHKQKLNFICSCGQESVVSSIRIARREKWYGCPSCIKKGIKRTCMEKYGASCPLQGKEIREKMVEGWKEKWGTETPVLNPEVQKKRRETMIERYGVEYTQQNAELRQKTKKNNIQKFGVDNPMKDQKVRETFKESVSKRTKEQKLETKKKRETTNLEKYGDANLLKNPEMSKRFKESIAKRDSDPEDVARRVKKGRETCEKRYGVSNPMMTKEVQQKSRESYKLKTGYDHPCHNPEVMSKILKSSFRKKEFVMPSGEKFVCQGFEPLVLKLLLSEGIEEEDILSPTEQGIKIPYFFEGKECVYHPDIFVKSLNLLIEVKSDWTIDGNGGKKPQERERTMEKLRACGRQGYNTRLYIFGKNKKLISLIEKDARYFE
ncbi:MutH/Vsr/archaeal HJR-like endonuclease [Golden Marseillevirus]|uniref:homing endonuclease n=1 Tax=Golden Marseillevirus TaxID=1720526 RepID=UPI000877AA38|nr:homing endonuclease [Golden Marseillevirus]ALX27541.1 MutH/Vsr/archaeal HJR-like endonuclease [Golden Marseillevirus]